MIAANCKARSQMMPCLVKPGAEQRQVAGNRKQHGQLTEQCGIWSYSTSRIVLPKGVQCSILGWASKAFQVVQVSNCLNKTLYWFCLVQPCSITSLLANLEVAAAYQQVNCFATLLFKVLHGVINLVKLSVTAALNSDLHRRKGITSSTPVGCQALCCKWNAAYSQQSFRCHGW